MKKILLPMFTSLLACMMLATAADAQDCRLEDGCDYDEDGVIDAYPSPNFGQYGDGVTPLPVVFPDEDEDVQNPGEQDFCGIPEGCDLDDDGVSDVSVGTPADEPPSSEPPAAPANPTPAGEASGSVYDPSVGEVGVEEVVTTAVPDDYSGGEAVVGETSTKASEAAPGGVLPDTGGNQMWAVSVLGGVLAVCGGILSRIARINASGR